MQHVNHMRYLSFVISTSVALSTLVATAQAQTPDLVLVPPVQEQPLVAATASSSSANAIYATNLTVGDHHACARLITGVVKCWGLNDKGQLGDGTRTNRNKPVQVVNLVFERGFNIAAGAKHTCAEAGYIGSSQGHILNCWGWNADGQLGDGTNVDRLFPTPVKNLDGTGNSPKGVYGVAAGGSTTCISTAGTVKTKCWGDNSEGQVGDGTRTDRYEPPIEGDTSSAPSVGFLHTCATYNVNESNGGAQRAKCWGDNQFGQLGDTTLEDRLSPVKVTATNLQIPHGGIAAGAGQTCAIVGAPDYFGTISNTIVMCWGLIRNGYWTTVPETVAGLTPNSVSKIAMGFDHVCVLLRTGSVKCWGENTSGQLGNGTMTASYTPVDVVGLAGVDELAAGRGFTCARLRIGTIKCWGDNDFGQLGDGTTIDRKTPVDVVGLFDDPLPPNTKAWTLMFYFAADNELENTERQKRDKVLKACGKNPHVNITVFWDGFKRNDTEYLACSGVKQSKGELNSGNAKTLTDFVAWSRQLYPASNYALTISDHGQGIRGFAQDYTDAGLIELKDSAVLSSMPKLDVLFFDACLMAQIEAIYQLQNVSRYFVAHQSVSFSDSAYDPSWFITGYGNVPAIGSTTSANMLARAIAETYTTHATAKKLPVNTSVIDADRITQVVTATSKLGKALLDNFPATKLTLTNVISKEVQRFNVHSDTNQRRIDTSDWLIDLFDFARLVKAHIQNSDVKRAADEVMRTIESGVIYNAYLSGYWTKGLLPVPVWDNYWDHSRARGLSIYFTDFSTSFYRQGYLNFCLGTFWYKAPRQAASTLTDSEVDDTIYWGPLLVALARENHPNVPDQPNPPELVAPFVINEISLPLVIGGSTNYVPPTATPPPPPTNTPVPTSTDEVATSTPTASPTPSYDVFESNNTVCAAKGPFPPNNTYVAYTNDYEDWYYADLNQPVATFFVDLDNFVGEGQVQIYTPAISNDCTSALQLRAFTGTPNQGVAATNLTSGRVYIRVVLVPTSTPSNLPYQFRYTVTQAVSQNTLFDTTVEPEVMETPIPLGTTQP